jgi:hypothetical protein
VIRTEDGRAEINNRPVRENERERETQSGRNRVWQTKYESNFDRIVDRPEEIEGGREGGHVCR